MDNVTEKPGIKEFIISDYLIDASTRREVLRVSVEEDPDKELDEWLCDCYEGLLKQRGFANGQ